MTLWLCCGLPACRKKNQICNFLLFCRLMNSPQTRCHQDQKSEVFSWKCSIQLLQLICLRLQLFALVNINKVKSLIKRLGCVIWGIPVISSQRKRGKRFPGSADGQCFLYMLYSNECWDELNTLLGRVHAAHRQTSAAQKGRVSFIKAGSVPFCFESL